MTKTGIVNAATFENLQHMPAVFTDNWQDVARGGIAYKAIYAFRQYFTDEVVAQLEAVFETEAEYAAWLANDMVYLAKSWKANYRDYKQAREQLKAMIAALGGFEALTAEEKAIAASWFTVPEAAINSTLSLNELLAAGATFDANSKASRDARYTAAFNYFRTVLNTADAVKVVNTIMYHNLETLYVKLGFEGVGTYNYKGAEDMVSIVDFIQSTPGTKFATAGLASLGLVPNYGLTVQDLIDKAIAIIKHGNY